jgi:hypothetical protein
MLTRVSSQLNGNHIDWGFPFPAFAIIKQDAFIAYWPWSVSVLFRFVVRGEVDSERLSLLYQLKQRFHLELDSKAQAWEDNILKKKSFWVCSWWNVDQGWFRVYRLSLGCQAKKQADARTANLKREKHVCSREVYLRIGQCSLKACPISTDGGTWYPLACRFLKPSHHIHSPYEKSMTERTT